MYREIAPSPALRPWVECFWSVSGEPAGSRRILPDGCADLVFEPRGGEAMVVGTMTTALLLDSPADAEFMGVRFHPGRAAAFLRIPLAEITDARVPLADVWKGWSHEHPDVAALEAELLRRLAPERDRRVDQAIARIVTSGGTARVEDLARETGLTRQHLARQFLHHVGVSPKTFARVMRFRRVVDAAAHEGDLDWAEVAADHGYYDQSHLIAEFRDLAGTTPTAFHFSNR